MPSRFTALVLVLVAVPASVRAQTSSLTLATPTPPPARAFHERALVKANAAACRECYERYFDDRGWLQCVERWGGDDGPDDAIENLTDWPILHALGASSDILHMYKKAWEGHLR